MGPPDSGRTGWCTDCAAEAIATGEEFGVWGGLAEGERPPPHERPHAGRGPLAQVSDAELYDLFDNADADRSALQQLLEHVCLPAATAYKYLLRAEHLGVIEHRGRGLFSGPALTPSLKRPTVVAGCVPRGGAVGGVVPFRIGCREAGVPWHRRGRWCRVPAASVAVKPAHFVRGQALRVDSSRSGRRARNAL